MSKLNWHYTTIDHPKVSLPGGVQTPNSYATEVNDAGVIVGAAQITGFGPHSWRGYSYSGGSFTTLSAGPGSTLPHDINNRGAVVGWNEGTSTGAAFKYKNGTYSQINGIRAATGDNDSGQVVGISGNHGVLSDHGHLTNIAFPSATSTLPEDISNNGRIVGYYTAADGAHHGFIGKPGHLRMFDVPGAVSTEAYATNDRGDVVGDYRDASGHTHGFVFLGGHFTSLDVPGSISTSVYGINNSREIVGGYADASGHGHGFSATDPPNPSASDLIATAISPAELARNLMPSSMRSVDGASGGWGKASEDHVAGGFSMPGCYETSHTPQVLGHVS